MSDAAQFECERDELIERENRSDLVSRLSFHTAMAACKIKLLQVNDRKSDDGD